MVLKVRKYQHSSIAQSVERAAVNRVVVGSSPTRGVLDGPVAQLVRAPPCHGGGRGFEPLPGRLHNVQNLIS